MRSLARTWSAFVATKDDTDQPGAVGRALGVAVPAALLLGPVRTLRAGSRSADILWLELAVFSLALYLLLQRRWAKREWHFEFALLSIAMLAPAVLVSLDPALGVVVFYRLALGLLGGWALASLWYWFRLDHWSPVDSGLVIVGLGTCIQLSLTMRNLHFQAFHEVAQLPWGGSSYVAAILTILGFSIWGRMVQSSIGRPWIAIPVAMLLMAVLAFSRSEFLAIAAGVTFLLVRGFSRQGWRRWGWAAAALVAPVGAWVFYEIVQTRMAGASAAHLQFNVQARIDLMVLSMRMFLASPFVGAGLGSLRDLSLVSVHAAETYAHNVELSLLGQAGILSVPYLALLAVCAFAAFRTKLGAQFGPAVVALLVISQFDPLFEGSVGGTFSWAILFVCYFAWRECRAQQRTHAPPLVSAHTATAAPAHGVES